MKRVNPYTSLKNRFSEWVSKAINRRRIHMWTYPRDKMDCSWSLSNLAERVAAADQLGYDVVLKSDDSGLRVEYVAKIPSRPWDI